MVQKIITVFLFSFLFYNISTAQQATILPAFKVENMGSGNVVVSWENPFGDNLMQISVQKSYDSLNRFSTLFTSESPALPQNGYTDKKYIKGLKVYYRIFYVLQGGAYYFTKSIQPVEYVAPKEDNYDNKRDLISDSLTIVADALEGLDAKKDKIKIDSIKAALKPIIEKDIYIKKDDSLIVIKPLFFGAFRDSILTQTNDTLVQFTKDTIGIIPYSPAYMQKASQYVFTDKDGYVVVKLPNAATTHYELKFLTETDDLILEIKPVKKTFFKLDKTIFRRAGWYKFELIENKRIKERNRVLLVNDF